ncbi:mitochondrial carrier domain-containing protein [Crepidotus variabilis]|uniref:Mitochondrial carrier domain-containing protein n=1 Tax=Crepidotus variabilis TaxID=179855 RepID=A0A9P6JND7_9AGAR|nr:mitochondrial carrier domain-containing protein [Crepidotus variabilis]
MTSAGTSPSASAPQVTLLPKESRTIFFVSPEVASYFVAGGCAGAASRTVVSPLERLKIIQQVQPRGVDSQYRGVWRSLARMWKEEGFKGFMRGNGINCLRIVPYSAVQFTTYEQLKKWFAKHGSGNLDTPTRLASGALAGITSVCSTYPLDLVRSRLSIATASISLSAIPVSTSSKHSMTVSSLSSTPVQQPAKAALASAYHTSSAAASNVASAAAATLSSAYSKGDLTIWGMTKKIMREEGGVKALYRGMVTTAVGVAPYVGINFAAYEFFRGVITPPGKSNVGRKLSCGALAGSISQTLTYPFDVLRRKMQVTGMKDNAAKYTGALHALTSIVKQEGVSGLYRGLWPNLLKVAPSIATSFFTYELVKEFLLPP